MGLAEMSLFERRVIFELMVAAAHGPFFSDRHLSIVFSIERHELLDIVARIPQIDDSEPNVRRAVGLALIDLHSYRKEGEWSKWISVSFDEAEQAASRWRSLQPPIVYEAFQVFGPACFGGKYYRVVAFQTRGGGSGLGCEVWSAGRWLFPNNGPGCPQIMAAVPASSEELFQAGVDCSPIPSTYKPYSLEYEEATTCVDKDATRV